MLGTERKGFSLIEMLVTLTIIAILLAVFVAMFTAAIKRNKQALNVTRLDQSMQTALNLMASDIRRAGFWGAAISGLHTHANNNPFNTTDISINGTNDCILFSYDQNGDGTLPSVGTNDERYGYRLMNSALQARPAGASFSCAAVASAWENLTDAAIIQITNLSFVETDRVVDIDGAGAGTASMTVRSIVISLTGRLTADTSVTKALSTQVKIRNDKYSP